jgi:hypothetical protein
MNICNMNEVVRQKVLNIKDYGWMAIGNKFGVRTKVGEKLSGNQSEI